MSELSLRLLGSLRLEIDGKPITVKRRKAVALLAYLAVTQQSHSRDALATLLWPEASQSRSRAALRSALWALNKTAVNQWIIAEPEALLLRPFAGTADVSVVSERVLYVDVIHFRELLSTWQRHDHSAAATCSDCLDKLTQAVSLYENDFLAGFTLPDAPEFDEWQFFQSNTLRQSLATALQGLIEYHSAQGSFSSAIPYGRRLVALDPLHEPAHRTLMELYAQAGQQSAALRQYDICQKALKSDLGLEPAEETNALYKRIHSGAWQAGSEKSSRAEADKAATSSTSRAPENVNPHKLPPNPTPFIGRQQELTRLAAFLDDQTTRLLTITGPGGIGKTRLALAVAEEQIAKANFPDGIYFVSLAPLSEPEAIVPAIAEAAGYPFQADKRSPRQQLFDFLSRKSTLLLLDNFEHLLFEDQTDGAAFVAALLQQAPHLKILVTSREPLNLYEEQRYPLQGLDIAEGDTSTDYAAAALFIETVRRRRPEFEIISADVTYLAEICRLVEGMPLALELAASWIEILSLQAIAGEIQQSLDLMETNVRNVPARHRSIQAVFDRSWQSLSESEQKIYAQLSVFRGGFTQEAGKAVASASRQSLVRLTNKSLLRFNYSQKRYEIHELLRQYAAAKLASATEATLDRHAAYFSAFLNKRETDLRGPRRQQALAEIEADGENALAAWQWSVERSRLADLEKALAPLALFYEARTRYREGERICRLALNRLAAIYSDDDRDNLAPAPSSRTPLLAKLLVWHGRFNLLLQQYENARGSLSQAQQIINNLYLQTPDMIATPAFLLLQLSDWGIVNEFGGKAQAMIRESLALYRSIGDAWGTAIALEALSQQKGNLGLHEEAARLQEESLAMRQRLQDTQEIGRAYAVLGLLLLHSGQIERSEAYLRRSLAIYRTMESRALLSSPLAILGINRLFAGNFEESIASWEEAWAIYRELGLAGEPISANVGMTHAKIDLGRYEEARRQARADLPTYRAVNHQFYIASTLFNLGRIDLVEGTLELARQRLEESAEIFQEMKAHRILPDALFCLAYTWRALNDRQQTIENMIQGLQVAIAAQLLNSMRYELPGMALLLADQGQVEQAVEFYTAALQSPYIASSRWIEDIAGRYITEMAATLPQDVVVTAQERGHARDLWATANELLAELSRVNLEE